MIKIIEIGESKKETFFDGLIIVPSAPAAVSRKVPQPQPLPVCPYCNKTSYRVWVHGHYQCQRCKNVISNCCEAV